MKKILKFAKKAGIQVIYAALLLFYVLKKPETPAKVKGTIVGALGYFILPLDLIIDTIPAVGYGDDLGAFALALGVAAMYIDEDVKSKAKQKLRHLFGDFDEEELGDIDKKY